MPACVVGCGVRIVSFFFLLMIASPLRSLRPRRHQTRHANIAASPYFTNAEERGEDKGGARRPSPGRHCSGENLRSALIDVEPRLEPTSESCFLRRVWWPSGAIECPDIVFFPSSQKTLRISRRIPSSIGTFPCRRQSMLLFRFEGSVLSLVALLNSHRWFRQHRR
jgi:hypothetical protein